MNKTYLINENANQIIEDTGNLGGSFRKAPWRVLNEEETNNYEKELIEQKDLFISQKFLSKTELYINLGIV